jgi:hypothetical protein
MKLGFAICVLVFALIEASQAQSQSASTVPVTADNFTRAESDAYFANIVKQAGGPGKFFHRREIEPVDGRTGISGSSFTSLAWTR